MAQNGSSLSLTGAYFRDRAVLITGASSGIGYDVALAFARRGAQVALLARRKTALQELADQITSMGGQALVVACDVTRRAEVQEAIAQTNRAFGQIDVLINSAGLLISDRIEDMRPEDLERMMAVNLYGTVHATQAVLPIMKESGSGSIVNIASLAGLRGVSPLGGYCASKFAVVGFTEALRAELFGSGIRVSLVNPGVIDTPMERQALSSQAALRGFPHMLAMPPRWVTWGILAAVALGLSEVDIPPGSGLIEKMASLFPGATDAMVSFGTRIMERAGRRKEPAEAPKVVRKEAERGARAASSKPEAASESLRS